MTHPDPEQVVPRVQLYILVWKPAKELKANVLKVLCGDFRQTRKVFLFVFSVYVLLVLTTALYVSKALSKTGQSPTRDHC